MAKKGKKGGAGDKAEKGKKVKGGKKDKGKKDEEMKDEGGKKKGGKAADEVEPPPPPPEPLASKFDPCRHSPESCSEALGCRPNDYPGLLEYPQPMAVIASESGSYDSLCKLLTTGFRTADRALLMTPWGNFVLFRLKNPDDSVVYFVFDGCTCNVNRFRFYDLSVGTAGLLFFKSSHEVLHYVKNARLKREHFNRLRKALVDDICNEYGEEFGDNDVRKICALNKSKVP